MDVILYPDETQTPVSLLVVHARSEASMQVEIVQLAVVCAFKANLLHPGFLLALALAAACLVSRLKADKQGGKAY
jgi:hypothetical protein